MLKQKILINIKNGLHIRPAAKLVKESKKFKSEIIIEHNNHIVNAKSLFKLQTLGIIQGDEINIFIKGKDEKYALKNLLNIIKKIK
ncbi:MAG: HPr family phosphocarrier protein [Enterobacteriaceae bacterium PSpyr]|nr:MAG: HPr family phosphocarrier protein [Enterobacteriaceae bacterium PSpyr]